jgi:Uma2 family endonuclease
MVGTPDLVIEVVSPSSEDKDTEWLMSAYHNAGISEYWVIDARADKVQFNLYKRSPKGFVLARNVEGWVKSKVLGRSFQVTRAEGRRGIPIYKLGVR